MSSDAPPRFSMPDIDAPHERVERYERRSKLAVVVAALAVLGATVFLFLPLFEGPLRGTQPYFEWDVPEQYWPDLVYMCGSLHQGELPYWNPHDRGGYPFYADPQAGTFHPLNWAICAVAGPSPGLGWASFRVVFGFALAGVFGLLWLRRIGASWSGAIVGAVLLEAAPFMRHNWELNLTAGLAYLPLMLFAADRVAVERRLSDGMILALAVALCGWVGSPPALFLSCSLTGLYLVFRLGEEARTDGHGVKGALPAIGAAAFFAVGLLGVVLVPAWRLAEHSVQSGRGFASIAEGGLEPSAMWALVWPRSGNHLYAGWLALAVVPIALWRRSRDRTAWFFLVVAAVAALLTMGAHGPLFELAYDLVPGVGVFRLPHRYEAWLGVALAALAAFGITGLARLPVEAAARLRLRIFAVVALGVAIALFFVDEGLTPGLFALALSVVCLAASLPRPYGLAAAPWGLVLAALVLVDVTQALPEDRHIRSDAPPGGVEMTQVILPHAPDTRAHFRLFDEFTMSCRSGTRLGRRDLRGYQDPLQLASYERVVGSLREHPGLAPQFNVRYALQGPHFIHGWNRHYLPPPSELSARPAARVRHRGEDGCVVTELTDALPYAYFVPADHVERALDRAAALERVRALAPSAVAVLEGADHPRSTHVRAGMLPESVARDLVARADRVHFTITARRDGVVVVNDAFYPGWRATVDGAPVPIVRANGFVRAVRVGAGRHEIEMRFHPDDGVYWRQAFLLSGFTLFGGLVVLPLVARMQRRVRRRRRRFD